MLIKTFLVLVTVSILLLPTTNSSQAPQYDLLIKLTGRVLLGPGYKR